MSSYDQLMKKIQEGFPQPISDPIHDSYLVHTIMKVLDQIDSLKGVSPVLGEPNKIDFSKASLSEVTTEMSSVEEVLKQLSTYLAGTPIWGHPNNQTNVIPPPSIVSVVAMLMAQLYNPNLVSEEYSQNLGFAELETIAMMLKLIGYDPDESAGIFTFGGTGTLLYGIKIGLETAIPEAMMKGVQGQSCCLFGSELAHWSSKTALGWLGVGMENFISVPTKENNEINTKILEVKMREALSEGKRIIAIVCTMGTTDACAIDNIREVVDIRDRLAKEFELNYLPHIHADAVIGWIWSVFNTYDFEENKLGFRARTLHALSHRVNVISDLNLADSVGIDFHKTGFTPYISSLILFKEKTKLELISRDKTVMPYLFHFDHYHPGVFTLEASRSASGMLAALANLKFFGIEGFQVLIGHLVEMAQVLREQLEAHAYFKVLNDNNYGSVTLFRIYPDDVNAEEMYDLELHDENYKESLIRHNRYNTIIAGYLYEEAIQGRGPFVSLTTAYRHSTYGEPIVAIKSYIMSPFINEKGIDDTVTKIMEAREKA